MHKSFDHLAAVYRALEYLTMGYALERVRRRHLPDLADRKQLLVVGEGDGRFLQQLLRHNLQGSVTVIERSSKMVAEAQRRLSPQQRQRVEFLSLDAQEACCALAQRGTHFDAVVTLFFLDCFQGEELERLVERLARLLRPGGLWVYGDFAIPRSFALRSLASAWIGLLYRVFGFLTDIRAERLEDPEPALRRQRLALLTQQWYRAGLLRTALWRRGSNDAVEAFGLKQLPKPAAR